MAIKFHILESSGILTGGLYEKLDGVLSKTANMCSQKLEFGDLDIVVMNVPWNVIPRIGVNGFAYDAHHILLTLDSEHENLKTNFENAISAVLAHELHHSARALILGSSHSLKYGGALVAEGLASCFEEEIVGKTPFYATECNGVALNKFAKKAKLQVNENRGKLPGGREQWMFGNYQNHEEFPYQCGYSTGYQLVKAWLHHNNETASSAVGVDADEVVNSWLNDEIKPF